MNKTKVRQALTNEYLTKNYNDNFTLALAAMESAKGFVQAGKDFTLSSLLEHMSKLSSHEKVAVLDEVNQEDNFVDVEPKSRV